VTYNACDVCDKKLTRADSGVWVCGKCNKNIDNPCVKYFLRVEAREGSVGVKMTGFEFVGIALFDKRANELFEFDVSPYFIFFTLFVLIIWLIGNLFHTLASEHYRL
jgi:hypothetical protein